jgi:hypothetical protein
MSLRVSSMIVKGLLVGDCELRSFRAREIGIGAPLPPCSKPLGGKA